MINRLFISLRMIELGLSIGDLARRLRMSYSGTLKFISGERDLRIKHIPALSRILRVPQGYLILRETTKKHRKYLAKEYRTRLEK